MKSMFAVLLLAAFTGMVQSAYAATPLPAVCDSANPAFNMGTPQVQTMIAGSSAMWQTFALGAYDGGNGVLGVATAPTFHYVNNTSSPTDFRFLLWDNRPNVFGTGNDVKDKGGIWIVWDSTNDGVTCTPKVWAYINIDSVAGNRAYFGAAGGGNYGTYITVGANGWGPDDANISNSLWGDSSTGVPPPLAVQNLFVAPTGTPGLPNLINVGSTDIRPEDAFYATTRVNASLQPAGAYQGLGYNPNNTTISAGTGPDFAISTPNNTCSGTSTLSNLVGNGIKSGYPGSTSAFNVVAFNLTGNDPFTCGSLPSTYTTIPVGAAPIVFVHSNAGGQLAGLTDANESELGFVFSGQAAGLAAGKVFAGCPSCAGNFQVFLREPLSGTYNTTEETVMRHPSSLAIYRQTQELNVDPSVDNPLAGNGNRYRAIGTGEEVKSVLNATTINTKADGIGYTFFSYGNINSLRDSANYSYIRLNGIDPIWHNYIAGTAGISDPAQNSHPGYLPGPADLPAGCAGGAGAFPCAESVMWKADNFGGGNSYSFPNLRNGSYASWSVVRLVVGSASGAATALVNNSQKYVVTTVPDYVPFGQVLCPASGSVNGFSCTANTVIDPGLQLVRSHFGCTASLCGKQGTSVKPPLNAGSGERGRDAGGSILRIGDTTINLTQDAPQANFVKFQ